jgi:PAS domain S-box-containing protein
MFIWDFQTPGPMKDGLPDYLKYLAKEQPNPEPYLSENLNKDGTLSDMQVDWQYIRSDSGEVLGFACVMSDISERLRTENALKVSEKRFRHLARLIPEIVFEADMSGVLTYANDKAFEILGYTREDIDSGINSLDTIRPEHRELAGENISRVLKGEDIGTSEYDLITKDGTFVPILMHSSPIVIDGVTKGIRGVIVDISSRKKIEDDLRLALQEKDGLIAEIHHRVKNNLLIVQSLLRLQSGGLEDDLSRNYLRTSEDRIRVISMIHERLYKSGDPKRIDPKKYFEALAAHLFRAYKVKPSMVDLNIDVSAEMMDVDTAIPCGLIVNELLTNCFRHAFPDGAKGSVHLVFKKHMDGECLISVRDTGTGLPDDFDVESADTFGMKILGTLIRQLKGELEVESLSGAWFRVIFHEKRYL